MNSPATKAKPTSENGRVRSYLTEREVDRLIATARKRSRYGQRDAAMILIGYRHGLRASELCGLQWTEVELDTGRLHVRRAKGGHTGVHPLAGVEIRALRALRREHPDSRYVFLTERGGPMTPDGFNDLFARIGLAAGMEFRVHPHMLRHACGFKLANDGRDTRTIQDYLGHRSINSTVRYTSLAASRFNGLWKD
jgi:integrase